MLKLIQDNLQAIYRISAPDVRHFLIDEAQLHEVLGEPDRPAEEWVLVRESADGVDVGVYVAEDALDTLQGISGPSEALLDAPGAFCLATEGVSHFMLLFERSRRGEPVSMLELEVQAEVDKFVVAALHHPGRIEHWHTLLFREARLVAGLSEDEQARYTEAARLSKLIEVHLEKKRKGIYGPPGSP